MLADVWARVVTPTCGVRIQCTSRTLPPRHRPEPFSPQDLREYAGRPGCRGILEPMPLLGRMRASAALICLLLAGAPSASGASLPNDAAEAVIAGRPDHETAADSGRRDWRSPTTGIAVVAPFVAPPHEYGPGHRGVDLAARPGSALVAPAGGVVAFSGAVADRQVITIDHGGGYVSTLEPVSSGVPAGTEVAAGAPVAKVSVGGHAAPGSIHFGVRRDGRYVNPLLLVDDVPRAVLLPCC